MSLPRWLTEEITLVPLKIDITYRGARYVDSFCWNINEKTNLMSPYEFACRTALDLGLPEGFPMKIALQIEEEGDIYVSSSFVYIIIIRSASVPHSFRDSDESR